tara:strand:- start:117 stop:335 length:219 start_codon:yes stop_codon:yes gene_type:complete
VTEKEVEDHVVVASKMDWNQLACIIIDLELEKMEFRSCLTESELEKYDKLLDIYESEKHVRVESLTTWNPYH